MASLNRLGKYEIRRPLGQGAMGTVYLGFDPDIERLVALKTIRVDTRSSAAAAGYAARFRNEARAAGRLQHANIVGVYEYGVDDALAFIVMEYVEGRDLASYARGRIGFDFGQVVDFMSQLLDALECAHRHGVVHRDVKPSNLLVRRDGTLKVTDFGVARVDTAQLTATGMVIGTPSYMSPEQCVGKTADARSDLFSAGVVLYELLTGEKPFAGPAEAVAYRICHDDPVAPSRRATLHVPAGIDAVVAAALAKDPARRFPTARAFREALLRVAGTAPASGDVDATRSPDPLPPVAADTPPCHLPHPVTSFVGRERELEEVAHLMRSTRMLTLTGTGGLGKTRLALEAARMRVREHPDGVFLVELAAVTDPSLVADAAATALGVRPEPGQPVYDALARHVANRALLVVIDNCEHLLRACAEVAKRLLESGRDVRIVATSREPLHVGGETVYPVAPLAAPGAGPPLAASELRRIPAVALFCDRARAMDPQFDLSAENAAAVEDICRRLEGIPLALELAAARVRALPIETIAARLGDRFRLLKGGDRTALPRQQTLRATIDWSHDLLSPPHQALLRRLAAFSGGFLLDAAEAVCAGGDVDADDVIDLLGDLVDKSLVVRDPERSRHALLETVRQYAQEKLDATGENASVRALHLRCFVALAEAGDPEKVDVDPRDWNVVFDRERDNLLAAHAYCDEAPDGGALGLRLVHALRNWLRRGSIDLAYRVAVEALARAGTEARDLLRSRALFTAGSICYFAGRYAEALRFADDSMAIAEELHDRSRIADALALSGLCAFGAGDATRASRDLLAAVALGRELDDVLRLHQALNCLAEVQSSTGQLDAALVNYEEALALARRIGTRDAIATTQFNLVRIEMARGSAGRAADLMLAALPYVDTTGAGADVQQFLTVAAGLAAHFGEWDRAARLFGAAEAWLERGGASREPADESFIAPLIARVRSAAGDASFAQAVADGRRLPFADVLEEARGWLGPAGAASTAARSSTGSRPPAT
ncbi:MAG: protein kinase [Burkholderiales bacterium]